MHEFLRSIIQFQRRAEGRRIRGVKWEGEFGTHSEMQRVGGGESLGKHRKLTAGEKAVLIADSVTKIPGYRTTRNN